MKRPRIHGRPHKDDERVQDVELIQRSLDDVARPAALLPPGHQEDLRQLLHKVEARPLDPVTEEEPPAEAWVVTT